MSDIKDQVRDQFGAHADAYVSSAVHAKGASLSRLVELTDPQPHWIVLDVSTGGGHTALAFAPSVARIVATDLTPQMLTAAERFVRERLSGETVAAKIEFKLADAENLPFGDSEFDLVTNRIALHHFADAPKAIGEMARVLKPGGRLALTDNVVPPDRHTAGYINHFEKMRDPSHNWAYPLVRLEAYFTQSGLSIEHREIVQKEMEFEPWAARMGATPEVQAALLKWLDNAPEHAREYWQPRREGDKVFFTLSEAIVIGRKG